jgi:DNA-directed RNA polymerase specialized sigma24 family protein
MRADGLDSTRVTLLHRLNANPADEPSWAEFVRVYGPAIRGWLLHWGLQEADVQDVTQNVLLRLTAKLPQFKYDPARSFRGWLKTLTHHAWHDFVTDAGYRHRGSGDTSILDQLQTVAAREAFRLSALEGVGPRAVADHLGVRVSQVYLARHRVQKLVQEEVRTLEGGDGQA